MLNKLRQARVLGAFLLHRGARDPLAPVTCGVWVTPFDVDLVRASSYAYLGFAWVGRWAWSFHNIDWRGLLRERWAPLTHTELVHYRRAASLFQRLEVTTTLTWWDDKMACLEHRITRGDEVSAVVHARGTFFRGRTRIPPTQCVVGLPPVPPFEKPPIVTLWEREAELFRTAPRAVDAPTS